MTAPRPDGIAPAVTIRTATAADVAAVDELLRRSYPRLLKPDYPPSVLVTAIPIIARAQPRLITCGTYYVAEAADGSVVGAGGWTRSILGNGGAGSTQPAHGNIRHVVTDHTRVRQGIGRSLMAHVLATARADGVTLMHCAATRTAVPFYAALGFVPLGEITIPIGAAGIGFAAVGMQRSL